MPGDMRIALISDTHGLIDGRVLEVANQCDVVVHAGDIGNCDVLMALTPRQGRVVAVRGNNDTPAQWPLSQHQELAQLPLENRLQLPGGELVVVHGHQHHPAARRHEMLRKRYASSRAVVYGHSHLAVQDCDAWPWVLNPGAAGHTRTYGGPSCLVLVASEQDWTIETYQFERQR